MIVFVRHGETEPNRQGLLLGRDDPPLTARGREQSRSVGEAVRTYQPVRVLSSPLARARASAMAIADACGTTVEVDERLIEIDYGEWEGHPFGTLGADIVTRWRRDPDFSPPGGESLREIEVRVGAFCSDWLHDDVVVAVSHVSPIKGAVTWALRIRPERAWRMRLDLASVTRIAPGPVVLSYNETLGMRA